jgi:hypothetical protein
MSVALDKLNDTHLTSRSTLVVDTTIADMQFPHSIPKTGMNASGDQNGLYPITNLVPKIETGSTEVIIERRTDGNWNNQRAVRKGTSDQKGHTYHMREAAF